MAYRRLFRYLVRRIRKALTYQRSPCRDARLKRTVCRLDQDQANWRFVNGISCFNGERKNFELEWRMRARPHCNSLALVLHLLSLHVEAWLPISLSLCKQSDCTHTHFAWTLHPKRQNQPKSWRYHYSSQDVRRSSLAWHCWQSYQCLLSFVPSESRWHQKRWKNHVNFLWRMWLRINRTRQPMPLVWNHSC